VEGGECLMRVEDLAHEWGPIHRGRHRCYVDGCLQTASGFCAMSVRLLEEEVYVPVCGYHRVMYEERRIRSHTGWQSVQQKHDAPPQAP
jgi:hypothetical protein